jgi:hypothetical protein
MANRLLVGAVACLMAYGATFTLLNPSLADAKHRRVLAGVGCHPDEAVRVDLDSTNDHGLYHSVSVMRAYARTDRSSGALHVTDGNGGQTVGVRCYVPTDSYLPHSDLVQAHVSGFKDASNGFSSYVKACYLWYTNGSYTCGPDHTLPSGYFNKVINLGDIWSNNARYPMITAVLRKGDTLHGVYYQD